MSTDVWARCPIRIQKCASGQEDILQLFIAMLNKLSLEEFELFLVQCWLIWNQRNTVVCGGKLQDPTQLNIRARDYLEEYKEAKNQLAILAHAMPRQSWRPPYGSVYKLNFDVAVFTQIGAFGCGVVVRNEMGLEHLQRFGYLALLAIIWRMRCTVDAPTDSANMNIFLAHEQ